MAALKGRLVFISAHKNSECGFVHYAFRAGFGPKFHIVPCGLPNAAGSVAVCDAAIFCRAASVAGDGARGPCGPRNGISSGILPGNSSGRGGSPGSRTGGGTSGRGLPGGASGGGSAGLPGVAGGISGGSIGIYIASLRWSTSRARSLAIVCSTVAAARLLQHGCCSDNETRTAMFLDRPGGTGLFGRGAS